MDRVDDVSRARRTRDARGKRANGRASRRRGARARRRRRDGARRRHRPRSESVVVGARVARSVVESIDAGV